ncbi:AAA family ATPase [Cognatishimia sp.]|uniref:AAA family ATPase n=1 Tax=Cognatishimia sp. TaxID=2211648 RepID=UPI003511F0A1|nr:AAA family ATPase [Cognatishimia sp.]
MKKLIFDKKNVLNFPCTDLNYVASELKKHKEINSYYLYFEEKEYIFKSGNLLPKDKVERVKNYASVFNKLVGLQKDILVFIITDKYELGLKECLNNIANTKVKAVLVGIEDPEYKKVYLPEHLDNFLTLKYPVSPLVHKLEKNLDIIGMEGLSKWLQRRVKAIDMNLSLSIKGISVLGVPGTGKTVSAHKCAQALNRPLYLLDIHSCLDKFQGNAEKSIDIALEQLKFYGKVVVLVDEVDKMFNSDLQDTSSVQRVLKKLLSFMDNNDNIFFVVTGNNIETIPKELIRKGRLDDYFYISRPTEKLIKNFIIKKVETYNLPKKYLNKIKAKLKPSLDNLVKFMEDSCYLYTDIKSYLDELVLDLINEESIDLHSIAKKIISSYGRYKEDYDKIEEWSKDNARNAN